MSNSLKTTAKITALVVAMLLQVACSDVKLSPYQNVNYSTSTSGINFCTTKADTIKSNLKFIFVVDRSGSNQLRYDLNDPSITYPGTDPTGSRRFDALLRFVDSFQSDEYIHWSMVNFASDARIAREFTNDKQGFYDFVQDQRDRTAQIDAGSTNYLSALENVYNMIDRDIEAARDVDPIVSSNYVIFFISDGSPIVQQQLQSAQQVLGRIETITSFEEEEKHYVEGIQVNTAYYYEDPIDLGARDLLNTMSVTGNGDFLEFASGQEIDFSRFAIPTRISRFALKEIWIANANTVWSGNQLVSDTDADGLPDFLEVQLGSNFLAYDSDGNGVGDGIEYRISGGRPCQDAQCRTAQANPYTTCRSLESAPGVFPDTDKDFLNDCEEKLVGTDRRDPDTNRDYVPDWMAFVNDIQMIQGTSDLLTDPDQDGLTIYQELKRNTPVRVHNGQVSGLQQLQYVGKMVSTNQEQDCFSYQIQKMPFHTRNDKIRIFLFENTKSIGEKIVFRVAEKQITPYGNVSVEEGEFR